MQFQVIMEHFIHSWGVDPRLMRDLPAILFHVPIFVTKVPVPFELITAAAPAAELDVGELTLFVVLI